MSFHPIIMRLPLKVALIYGPRLVKARTICCFRYHPPIRQLSSLMSDNFPVSFHGFARRLPGRDHGLELRGLGGGRKSAGKLLLPRLLGQRADRLRTLQPDRRVRPKPAQRYVPRQNQAARHEIRIIPLSTTPCTTPSKAPLRRGFFMIS